MNFHPTIKFLIDVINFWILFESWVQHHCTWSVCTGARGVCALVHVECVRWCTWSVCAGARGVCALVHTIYLHLLKLISIILASSFSPRFCFLTMKYCPVGKYLHQNPNRFPEMWQDQHQPRHENHSTARSFSLIGEYESAVMDKNTTV